MPATIFGNSAAALGLYQAFYGKAPGYATFTNNVAVAVQSGPSALATAIANNFNSTSPSALAATVLTNVGITNAVLQDALTQYFTAYTSPATRGQVVLNLVTLLSGLEGDAVYGSAASSWNKLVASNNLYSSNSANAADAVVNAKVFVLTDGIDNIVGNAADSAINAPVVQNQDGTLVNTLETGDVIDAGAGTDTLNVVLSASQAATDVWAAPAISATVSGVEIVSIRDQFIDNDLVNNSDIDAELHAGVKEYWSTNSRGDVQIEDVRQLPEELLFGMRQTDPVNTSAGVDASDFRVYFDPAQLAADRGTSGNSSLTLTLIDTTPGASQLANFPVNGVKFTLGGTSYTVSTTAALGATYAAAVASLQAALKAIPALANVTVTLNANNTITLTDPAGATFATGGYTFVDGVVPAGGALQWNQVVGAAVRSEAAISTTVVLDAVGRTSQGGILDIGSMADGGIEVFNVSVDRASWLTAMGSQEDFGNGPGHLETVNLTSIGANGNLTVGQSSVGVTGELDGRARNGLTDVREVLNKNFKGELNYGVNLTDASIGRYLDVATGEVLFKYEGGIGNDNISIADSSAGAALSDDGDFAMDVLLGTGNDRLNLDVANVDNVVVDGGAGDNVIAVARSHGTTAANTFEGFSGFATYEVELGNNTAHDFTSMTGVRAVNIATTPATNTELRDLAADAAVTITGKNQTLSGANASNANQTFGTVAINGADATATDTTLKVTLANTARLDGTLTVNQLSIGDLGTDVNPIRTLELVSAGQRNTANVVQDISAALVNTFTLSGTQDLTAAITAAANSTAIAANRASLVVNGTALGGDLNLTMAGALVTAVDAGTTSTVTLTGAAGTADVLNLTGALNTTNDTTIGAFETVRFTNGSSGIFDGSNVTGVTLYDINDTAAGLSLVDMRADARINVNIDDDVFGNSVSDNALMFDAATQAVTNTLDLEFRDSDTNAADNDVVFVEVTARDYREISLDLGGYATQNENYSFNLRMQDAEGDDEADPVAIAGAIDAANVYDIDSVYARKLTVVGGGDQGAKGSTGGVDSVNLGILTNALSDIDVSSYVGQVTLDLRVVGDIFVDRNTTITLNGYGANIIEQDLFGFDETIVTYKFTTDAVATTEDVTITGFDAFFGLNTLKTVSVLDLSALGVNGLADMSLNEVDADGDGFVDDLRITSNEGLNFQIDLIGVALVELSNENFKFAA